MISIKKRLHYYLERVGLFVFFFLIFESRAMKQDRHHPHQQSRASSHSKHLSEHPGRPWRKAPRPGRFVQSGDSSPWCQEHAEHDEDTSDNLLHVSAPRVWVIGKAESLFRPTRG